MTQQHQQHLEEPLPLPANSSSLQLVEVSSVTIPSDRQRQLNKNSNDLKELKASILSKGLFHAPLLHFPTDSNSPVLLAGERRFLAIKEISEDGLTFNYNGEVVLPGWLPYTTISQLSEIQLQEAELEENILRADLTWQERAAASAKIHRLRQLTNPQQTLEQTAIEILTATAGSETARKDKTRLMTERRALAVNLTVSQHLNDPRVTKAKNVTTAYRQILDKQRAEFMRDLQQLTNIKSNNLCIKGDCREVMKTLEKNSFDIILCDPPYGIDIDKAKETLHHHYIDSKDYSLSLCKEIIAYGWNLLKPQGIGFMFCDIEHFITLRTMADQMLYSTWRKPIIWNKGIAASRAPWGSNGFAYTYECLLFFVKGQRALVENPGADIISVDKVSRYDKLHAAEKPPALLKRLLQMSCRPGDRVLDPCCGAGSIFEAAEGLQLSVVGVELDDAYHAMASARLYELENASASATTSIQS